MISEQWKAAVAFLKAGQTIDALDKFSEILATAPQHSDTRRRLAREKKKASPPPRLTVEFLVNLFKTGDLTALDEQLQSLLKTHPLSPALWELKGALEKKRKNNKAALRAFRFAVMLNPDMPTAHNNLGLALQDTGDIAAALASFLKAVKLKRDYAEAWRNLGLAQKEAGQTEQAIESFYKALEIRPNYTEAHYSLGTALLSLNQFEEAISSLQRALSLRPDFTRAHFNKAIAHRSNGQLAAAKQSQMASLLAAAPALHTNHSLREFCQMLIDLEIVPAIHETQDGLDAAHESLLQTSAAIQDWIGNNGALRDADAATARKAATIFAGFYFGYQIKDDRALLEPLCPALQKGLNLPTTPFETPRKPGKLRIGIAAHKLRDHNGANYCYHWFSNLPREDYEFFTYSFGPSTDTLGNKFRQLGTHRDIPFNLEKIDDHAAEMRQDDLDFLMLPEVGMTNATRMMSMCRLARHQATGWGHPVTTGSSEMDFFISSDLHEVVGADVHYSEELVLMPNLAQFVEPPDFQFDPEAFNFETGTIRFGCLQSLFKYIPKYDAIFAEVAKELPQSRFFFLEGTPPYLTLTVKERLRQSFSRLGLDVEKHVIFMPRQTSQNYDNLMQSMDVMIDTIGWSGGNTSLKCLGMNKPLVTLPGTFMRGRHALAMYCMLDYHDLVASDVNDFVAKLVVLASDKTVLEEAREVIRQRKQVMYQDWDFIQNLDEFLKAQLA